MLEFFFFFKKNYLNFKIIIRFMLKVISFIGGAQSKFYF